MNRVKRALITGGSRGIGEAIAKRLKKEGYEIYIIARNLERLQMTAEKIGAKGFSCGDLSNEEDIEKLSRFAKEKEIDVLVNNAGEYVYGEIEAMDKEKIKKIFGTNLIAPVKFISACTPHMKSSNWGRIINIGSISGVMGEAYASLYSGSKSGLIGLSKALALELAEFHITVNTINPGWVDTDFGISSVNDTDFTLEETKDIIPQKRFVKPEEVAGMVNYLVSDEAKGVTGQSINLCAGLSVGY